MIRLTRCDGQEILLNVEFIRSVDARDTTVVTLTTGETLAVKNTPADIAIKVRAYQQGLGDERKAYDDSLRPSRGPKDRLPARAVRTPAAPLVPAAEPGEAPEETP